MTLGSNYHPRSQIDVPVQTIISIGQHAVPIDRSPQTPPRAIEGKYAFMHSHSEADADDERKKRK